MTTETDNKEIPNSIIINLGGCGCGNFNPHGARAIVYT